MHRLAVVCLAAALLSSAGVVAQDAFQPTAGLEGKDVIWVPTPAELVEKMLDMANVTPQDFVIDLGSGDGRNVIAAARRGARALGVEYNPDLVELSRRLAREAGVGERATFVQGDMYAADVSQATVLALFLKPENLDRMQDKFLAMKPGTRIVLNTFPITDWDPDVTETLGPPCRTWCTAMLVVVPARVGGSWQMGATTMTLKQYYQVVRGTVGTQQAIGHLRGDQITLSAGDTEYAGQVAGDRIDGFATTAGKRTPWTARLARGVPAIDH
ncbi:MAG: class I SAM-dependent methyltransferase [Vicinamibacterales bacterium]|nr:class I SAM-dependent methyltransferase [Vicinamibacterales bacterium]